MCMMDATQHSRDHNWTYQYILSQQQEMQFICCNPPTAKGIGLRAARSELNGLPPC